MQWHLFQLAKLNTLNLSDQSKLLKNDMLLRTVEGEQYKQFSELANALEGIWERQDFFYKLPV